MFKLSCKKSPQTWGLKEEVKQRKSTHEHGLQKESPDMGIESLQVKTASDTGRQLAKRVPRHGD